MNLLGVDTSPLHPQGPAADRIQYIYTPIFWVSMVFWAGVTGLILFAALRFRRKYDDEEPLQTHGNTRLESAWTLAPFLILATLFGITAVNQPFLKDSPQNAMLVNVDGHQFGWTYQYADFKAPATGKPVQVLSDQGNSSKTGGDNTFTSENAPPFVIPENTAVELALTSNDVIHSYYVPTLGGQINVVPGQTNHLWIQAAHVGEFFGQCTELCGLGHAHMFVVVVAITQDNFSTWTKACGDAIDQGQKCNVALFTKLFNKTPDQYGQ